MADRLRIDVVSAFPELVRSVGASSIVGRAQQRGVLELTAHDPRWWAGGRHRQIDDRPYGGGPGMVLAAPPIAGCIDFLLGRSRAPTLLMSSPQGRALDQAWVDRLAEREHLSVLCGHYEGIDERIVERYRPQEFSIGDVVVSGGELPALVLVDAVTRRLPGALGDATSAEEDSFTVDGGLLDAPCYTRPEEFDGLEVPEVLRSGDHDAIAAWRHRQRVERTRERRPDLLRDACRE